MRDCLLDNTAFMDRGYLEELLGEAGVVAWVASFSNYVATAAEKHPEKVRACWFIYLYNPCNSMSRWKGLDDMFYC